MMTAFRVIQGSPCNPTIAPYFELIRREISGTVNSIYRGEDAASILHAHGKHTQAELYATLPPGQANPPGRSTHELRSDGVAYAGPIGRVLEWWQQGIDTNDDEVESWIAAAKTHRWELFRPYPSGVEFHHLNFRKRPVPASPLSFAKIVQIRHALPTR